MRYSTVSALALVMSLAASPVAFSQAAQGQAQPGGQDEMGANENPVMQPAQPDAGAAPAEQSQDGAATSEQPAQAQTDSQPVDDMQSEEAQSDNPAPAETQTGQTATEPTADQDMAAAPAGDSMANIDDDMKRVIDKHVELGAKPLAELTVEEARAGPTIADAVEALMAEMTAPATPDTVATEDMMIPGAAGQIPARVYTPASVSADTPAPVILYFHGGGWVIADIDVYDGSARALAEKTGAIVVSSGYRQAPENPFPASHDDAIAAYSWVVENAQDFNGDGSMVAVAGESAGGGLAAHVAIQAREQQLTPPVHQLLIYPIAGTDTNTPSYEENAMAKPLDKAGMEWFFDKVLTDPAQMEDPRVDLVGMAEVEGVAPATIITAEIDPLRSEGEAYAQKLESAGVETEHRNFEGVTHEFFGTAAVVADAEEAQNFAAERLMAAFGMDAATTSSVPADEATMEGAEPAMQDDQPAMEEEPAQQ